MPDVFDDASATSSSASSPTVSVSAVLALAPDDVAAAAPVIAAYVIVAVKFDKTSPTPALAETVYTTLMTIEEPLATCSDASAVLSVASDA